MYTILVCAWATSSTWVTDCTHSPSHWTESLEGWRRCPAPPGSGRHARPCAHHHAYTTTTMCKWHPTLFCSRQAALVVSTVASSQQHSISSTQHTRLHPGACQTLLPDFFIHSVTCSHSLTHSFTPPFLTHLSSSWVSAWCTCGNSALGDRAMSAPSALCPATLAPSLEGEPTPRGPTSSWVTDADRPASGREEAAGGGAGYPEALKQEAGREGGRKHGGQWVQVFTRIFLF
jgi:hypothetical protein